MSQIGDRLRKAIADQRRPSPERRPVVDDARIAAAFRPVSEAAAELKQELLHVPGLEIVVRPNQVRIELHGRYLWFSYSPETEQFLGSELTSLWMEGGLHEEDFAWDTAEACVEAMIQACAQYVSLAEALSRLETG